MKTHMYVWKLKMCLDIPAHITWLFAKAAVWMLIHHKFATSKYIKATVVNTINF